MEQTDLENRLINIEMALDCQQKTLEDLSDVVIRQGKLIDNLMVQTQMLKSMINQDVVKPLNEETPPPHY